MDKNNLLTKNEEKTMIKKTLKWIGLILILINLTACSEPPPGMAVNVQAANYLNPDVDGVPAPVVVIIFQLKSPFSFNNADYVPLVNNSARTLGEALIDKQTTEIRPREKTEMNLPLTKGTKYIGIVAAYRNINQTRWHTAIKIPTGKKSVKIGVYLEAAGLNVNIIK